MGQKKIPEYLGPLFTDGPFILATNNILTSYSALAGGEACPLDAVSLVSFPLPSVGPH